MTADATPEFKLACEARAVCRLSTRAERAAYLARVEQKRGKAAADKLGEAVKVEWDAMKNTCHQRLGI